MNKAISFTAFQVLSGKLVVDARPYYCLSTVRGVIEAAMGWCWGEFYKRYLITKADGTDPNEPAARDMQKSLRQLGYDVKPEDRQAGDIITNWKLAYPYGHIAILLTKDLILENSPTHRPGAYRNGELSITPYSAFPEPVELFRLQERGS